MNKIDLLKHLPAVLAAVDQILDRIPKDEMIARYNAGGIRIRATIEETEIALEIRPKERSA